MVRHQRPNAFAAQWGFFVVALSLTPFVLRGVARVLPLAFFLVAIKTSLDAHWILKPLPGSFAE
jgi:hypothetical protein